MECKDCSDSGFIRYFNKTEENAINVYCKCHPITSPSFFENGKMTKNTNEEKGYSKNDVRYFEDFKGFAEDIEKAFYDNYKHEVVYPLFKGVVAPTTNVSRIMIESINLLLKRKQSQARA